MPDFLERMAATSRARVRQAKGRVSIESLRRQIETRGPTSALTLRGPGFDVIAEIKRRAPSAGDLVDHTTGTPMVTNQANAYARGGAAAVSVLTEPSQFHGRLGDLEVAARAISLPLMRKDFLVDPFQVFEARAHGASGVLVIARIVDAPLLDELLSASRETGQFVLIEVFDRADLETAHLAVDMAAKHNTPLFVGVNARDLSTLDVRTECFAEFATALPVAPWVAESGIECEDQVRRVVRLGYRAALIGSALMRATDPIDTLSKFIGAGREESLKSCTYE